MTWVDWNDGLSHVVKARCACCANESIWITRTSRDDPFGLANKMGDMIYPSSRIVVFPDSDMPDDVKREYEEAASVFNKSPRAAAALLRLGLQRLCRHLGEPGDNLNDDIRSLAQKNVLPPLIVHVADTVRITGNNSVHPGEMSEADIDHVASKMFDLLNIIVRKGISEPKELKALYEMTPEGARISAEEKDAKARSSS